MAEKTLEAWVDALQARGRYTFLRTEAVRNSGLSSDAVKKALQRLARRRRVAKIKDHFYVIVPLEHRSAGCAPPAWFIDDLMKSMNRPYYVGLLSAAAIHGAAHQQPQQFQVITDRPVRPMQAGRARIRLIVNKHVGSVPTQDVKTPTGKMRISTPEATVVDLIRYAKSSGHLDHVATVIRDLIPLLDPQRLLKAVRVVGDTPHAQRLGVVLESLREKTLAKPIQEWVDRRRPNLVPLRAGRAAPGAKVNLRWNVAIDSPLEIES
ncbi:MAG: type IV toxin-antitoxin system AbiEi family antitoxin [Phycisphaerales bacterium]|nr:type IV toxin-antitoxin system AbiEi family antitoxin [Phycisphaerales bacterium]